MRLIIKEESKKINIKDTRILDGIVIYNRTIFLGVVIHNNKGWYIVYTDANISIPHNSLELLMESYSSYDFYQL